MKNRILIGFGSVVFILFVWFRTAAAEGLSQKDVTNVFLGSPVLILGILAGIVATAFAFYSAFQMKGGRMGIPLALLGLSVLSLDVGVIAVVFFTVTSVTQLAHDLGLLIGFLLALIAFVQMRRIVG